jgi:hypothetical protein
MAETAFTRLSTASFRSDVDLNIIDFTRRYRTNPDAILNYLLAGCRRPFKLLDRQASKIGPLR